VRVRVSTGQAVCLAEMNDGMFLIMLDRMFRSAAERSGVRVSAPLGVGE
jgi:predicted nucleic acid-binding protein